MNPTCQDGRMPWPCQLAWGIALIACVAVLALVLTCLSPATGAAAAGPSSAPPKETPHAQP